MVETGDLTENIITSYSNFMSSTFPQYFQDFINIFLLVVLVVIYAVLIWKFYRFIGKKNIIELNLSKYNTTEHPFFTKFLALILYLLEYIIILPFLVFIWFTGFASFLIVLSNNLEIQTILFLAVTIIGSIRMTSYIPKFGEDLAKEIAKIIPFTLLAVFILNPQFFDFSRVISHFLQLPTLYGSILTYLSFIIILEVLLRFFDLIFKALGLHEEVPVVQPVKQV